MVANPSVISLNSAFPGYVHALYYTWFLRSGGPLLTRNLQPTSLRIHGFCLFYYRKPGRNLSKPTFLIFLIKPFKELGCLIG